MLETSGKWWVILGLVVGACATEPEVAQAPAPQPAAPVVAAPAAPPPGPSQEALLEEARALLAQAETDVQRARARRALWQRAWEDLIAARQAVAARNSASAARFAHSASEFAKLGLEQLAFPAVK